MAVQRDKVIASAEKLVAKGKIEPAIKEYERLLDDNPNDVNTLNRIGDLWVRINRNDEAVKVFAKIADHYSKDGFFLKAIAIYKKINKLDPSKLDIYAKLADLYAKQGLAMEAKSQYQVLADYYLKHGDPGNALMIYRKISELDPNSINVHVKLADLYSQNNQTAEALKEYDRVGRMLLKRGMLDEAVQVFRKALKIDSSNVDLVESLVTALLEAKDYPNAAQIVEAALESNRENPRLLALLGRIYLGRGDMANAQRALERGLASNPMEPSLRDSLADLYLRTGNSDKALEMLAPLAEKALAKGERAGAVEVFNRVLRVDAGHAPTLERLVALYTRLNEETNIVTSLNGLAEAHIAKGRYEEAAAALERLIDREPQNAQYRNKLTFVRSQMGGTDTLPARAKTAHNQPLPPPLPLEMEIDEPVPSIESLDDEPSLTLGLDDSEPIELAFEDELPEPAPIAAAPPPPPPPPPPVAPPPRLTVEKPAPPPAPPPPAAPEEEGGEDLDFITEHLTEAEVFAKYGLAEKAAEHLRAVLERAPKHLVAHDKLFRVLLDEGDVDAARAAATAYINVLQEKNDAETVSVVQNEFLNRGHSLAPAPKKPAPTPPPVRPPTLERPAPPPVAPPPTPPRPADALSASELAGGEEFSIDIETDDAEFSLEGFGAETPSASIPPTIEPLPAIDLGPEPEPEPEPEMLLPEPEMLLPDEEPVAQFEDSFGGLDDDSLSFGEEPAITPEQPIFADSFGAAEPDLTFEAAPAIEEIGEIDFYIEQELFDEAKRKIESLLTRFPDNRDVRKRKDRLDAAIAAASAIAAAAPPPPTPKPVAPPPPPPPPPAQFSPASLSRDEIESELLSAIPDDDDEFGTMLAAPPPPPPPTAQPVAPPPVVKEDNLFADEDDFFDLAAELESELEEDEEPISLSEEEQSLEEIFKEFKKGVEQQLDSEDYDTHYNLGIAYKEMGLIDEAIGEFQLASKDPKRAVECASMLGLCFLEKGMPQLAIKWYRKGLEIPEITEEEHIGLLYDLGSAHMEVGDTDNAQKAFMEVYGMNTNYRDIVTRIKQLEDARK